MVSIDSIRRKGYITCRRWGVFGDDILDVRAAVFVERVTMTCEMVIYTSERVIHRLWVRHPVTWCLSPQQEEQCVANYVRRVLAQEAQRGRVQGAQAEAWVAAHPALWEYLTMDRFDDGAPRATSTLCLFAEEGMVKLALQDRQEGRSLWVTAGTPEQALDALEGHLAAGSGEWRRSRQPGTSQSGGRQRRPG